MKEKAVKVKYFDMPQEMAATDLQEGHVVKHDGHVSVLYNKVVHNQGVAFKVYRLRQLNGRPALPMQPLERDLRGNSAVTYTVLGQQKMNPERVMEMI